MNYLIAILFASITYYPIMAQNSHDNLHNHSSSQEETLNEADAHYTCPMHPNIKSDTPGNCPICGMELVAIKRDNQQNSAKSDSSKSKQLNDFSNQSIYTCPMHPNIKTHEPGRCPICGMDLVPLNDADSSSTDKQESESIHISKTSRRLAGIETQMVEAKPLSQSIKAVGSLSLDEGRVATISAYVDGRIEKLYADYTGVLVTKGEHLAEFYSPSLYAAQVEYLQAGEALAKMEQSNLKSIKMSQTQLLQGVETKLKELGMTPQQIVRLKKERKAQSRLTLVSQVTGTVIEKNAVEGSYVKTGQVIYKVADLSNIWLLLDLFPEETVHLRFGQKVYAKIRSSPHREFIGRISFIAPVISEKTRTVRVRVEIPNNEGMLKPGDYAEATIKVPITPEGKHSKTYDPELAGKYFSPMHPQIITDKPGSCPICGMNLVPTSQFGYSEDPNDLKPVIAIPRDGVITVGFKSVVFVESSPDRFTLREVSTGVVTSDNQIIIQNGLKEGEIVATSGVFLIDSQMQLSGKTSLMNVITSDKVPSDNSHQHHH